MLDHQTLKPITLILLIAIPVYGVSWTVCYSIFMGFNYKYFFKYLYLAWTGPGPIPSFIQIFSIGLTLLVCFIVWRKRRATLRDTAVDPSDL
jgi:hypothetical protein